MDDKKKSDRLKEDERRRMERFAWLGPLLERRKHTPDPLEGNEDEGEELEEIKE